MSEKAELPLSSSLLMRIEENRGNLTREEFLEVCVGASLGRRKAIQERPCLEPHITREEFEEFKSGVRNLLRSSFNFFMLYWIELCPETREGETDLRGRLLNTFAANT